MADFNAAEYIKNANAKEQTARDGKPVETPVAAVPAKSGDGGSQTTEPVEDNGEHARLSRSQRRLMRQLGEAEGRAKALEEMLGKLQGAKPAQQETAAATPTAAERDARKAKPSEAVAARGGSAPAQEISPVLGDGRTLNPMWKERANMREGRRQ